MNIRIFIHGKQEKKVGWEGEGEGGIGTSQNLPFLFRRPSNG